MHALNQPHDGRAYRSWLQWQQPQRFTSYLRDANESDEAMHRRYNRWWGRFNQPDPSDGSYDLTDPQSLNRYAYVNNDPVNFVDPSGLLPMSPDYRPPDDLSRGNGLFSPGIHTYTFYTQTSNVVDGVRQFYPGRGPFYGTLVTSGIGGGGTSSSPLEFLFTGAQERYLGAVKDAFADIALDDNCAAVFQKYKLPTPIELARKGLLVGGSGLLVASANNKLLGISEKNRRDFFGLLSDGFIYYGAPAIAIVSTTTRPSIILGPNAFNGKSELSLRGILVHELIHAAGVPGDGSRHDLNHFKDYKDILNNCPK